MGEACSSCPREKAETSEMVSDMSAGVPQIELFVQAGGCEQTAQVNDLVNYSCGSW